MKFAIKSCWTAEVLYVANINTSKIETTSVTLGKAVVAALKGNADLRGANLRNANLRNVDLGGADLGGADLRGANLRGANLRGANLRVADLDGADLGGADLGGADLGGADLGGANLRGANLGGADLRNVDLGGADLGGADLGGADLGGAVAQVTKLITSVLRSDGYVFLAFAKENGTLGIIAGCRNFTLEQFRAHVATNYPGTSKAVETIAILDLLEKRHAALRSK